MKKFMVQMNPDLKLGRAATKFLVEAENVVLKEDYAVFLNATEIVGVVRSPVSVLVQPESDRGE